MADKNEVPIVVPKDSGGYVADLKPHEIKDIIAANPEYAASLKEVDKAVFENHRKRGNELVAVEVAHLLPDVQRAVIEGLSHTSPDADLVERVAKAIYQLCYPSLKWWRAEPSVKPSYIAMARAALEVIPQPDWTHFFYLLGRDAAPSGAVEGVFQKTHEVNSGDTLVYSNPELAEWARQMSERMRSSKKKSNVWGVR